MNLENRELINYINQLSPEHREAVLNEILQGKDEGGGLGGVALGAAGLLGGMALGKSKMAGKVQRGIRSAGMAAREGGDWAKAGAAAAAAAAAGNTVRDTPESQAEAAAWAGQPSPGPGQQAPMPEAAPPPEPSMNPEAMGLGGGRSLRDAPSMGMGMGPSPMSPGGLGGGRMSPMGAEESGFSGMGGGRPSPSALGPNVQQAPSAAPVPEAPAQTVAEPAAEQGPDPISEKYQQLAGNSGKLNANKSQQLHDFGLQTANDLAEAEPDKYKQLLESAKEQGKSVLEQSPGKRQVAEKAINKTANGIGVKKVPRDLMKELIPLYLGGTGHDLQGATALHAIEGILSAGAPGKKTLRDAA